MNWNRPVAVLRVNGKSPEVLAVRSLDFRPLFRAWVIKFHPFEPKVECGFGFLRSPQLGKLCQQDD